MKELRVGLDVGSTTAKMVALDDTGKVVFSKYERHNADVKGIMTLFFDELKERFGNIRISLSVTGSVGMGFAETFGIPFIQEVVAATGFVREVYPGISTIIDIGGEDAKIVYLKEDGTADLRMNGNCAGGTGAFIDQMALLLGVDVSEMDALAAQADRTYPIASRCGVFSKTDVQNLISKNVSKADIAASIFHAVAVQTVVTLSHGCTIDPQILLCGGPLTFIPALRKAFVKYLNLSESDFVVPENANMVPAWGAALSSEAGNSMTLDELSAKVNDDKFAGKLKFEGSLDRIFSSEAEYEQWQAAKNSNNIERAALKDHKGKAFLGIDSGSTTTKIVVTDENGGVLFTYYAPNGGNPIQSIKNGLSELDELCRQEGVDLSINGSCSTGYGEDLIKAAFGLDSGIIETIAHYMAARRIDPDVSFILDIGGQDMKAIFVNNGVINRMELNEACSSGCGSFIETFSRSLGYDVTDFARTACLAENPCDLGTRCTVFMNSKVKQVLREGASVGDIAAGLTYSVVKNCLYKVLKLKDTQELGGNIVVQGGTMRNDSVVRALELLTGVEVGRSNIPELMGAYGCALYARVQAAHEHGVSLANLLETASYTTRQVQCKGCENQCYVHKYSFVNGNVYFSGNKCEKVFANGRGASEKGRNLSTEKYNMYFDRENKVRDSQIRMGVPRCLNMYENYPFWHTLFEECGIEVVLSSNSTFRNYESGVHSVMSDNICFPAKLVHSHIYELVEMGVDRIFFPYVVFERQDDKGSVNSYNCPIVTGYSDVIKSAIDPSVPVDSPVITFKERKSLTSQCVDYLSGLGIEKRRVRRAVETALAVMDKFNADIRELNTKAYEESKAAGKLTIVLAGRPYHTDPLVQHKLSDMIAEMGVTVLTEDIVRGVDPSRDDAAHIVPQWSYINRILRAAHWVARQGNDVHFVQMTSFGCGPDAFLTDEIKDVLNRHGKSLTLLKIDDINNIGSVKLRVRSLVDSIKFGHDTRGAVRPFVTTRQFGMEDRKRTILVPYFTDYISPFVPVIMGVAGYNAVGLPKSDAVSADYGLKYANNEVCYPATLIVGDLIKALDSGQYDLDNTAVIITQTGGQCRASNYIALIKRGLVEAGFEGVPVLSLATGNGLQNEQEGFKIKWSRIIGVTVAAILFGDCIAKFYFSATVREKNPGDAAKLRDHYIEKAKGLVAANNSKAIYELVGEAAADFNEITVTDDTLPKVGVVGEIFLKFNSFSHKSVVDWLVERKVEVMAPVLTDFFMQTFVNTKVNRAAKVERSSTPQFFYNIAYTLMYRKIKDVNRRASAFRYFVPFHDIFETAKSGGEVVNMAAQFGEGWLLPGEIVSFAKRGVNNVISLQPFGCIANHIVSRGVEKKIKTLYPKMNILSLDFDSGVSDVNVTNRMLLLTNNLK